MDILKRFRKLEDRVHDFDFRDDVMNRGSSLDLKDFMAGLVLGTVLGSLTALLFAPKSGYETRSYLTDKSHELGEKAKSTVDDAMDKTGRLVEEGKDRVESVLDKGQKEADRAKNRGQNVAHEAREQASDTLHRAADEVDPKPRF